MKYLIIGLGNPGAKYENTRHNIGFKVLDNIARLNSISFFNDRLAQLTQFKYRGRNLILIKPNTFMNLSGKAVVYWMQKEKVHIENVLVISDDISLPLGVLRLRAKGSDGGHNGLKDIQNRLESKIYSRLRFGIGNDFPKGFQSNYVLSNFTNDELIFLENKIELATEMIKSFVTVGLNQTMSNFNRK